MEGQFMRRLAIGALCVLVGVPALWALDDPKDKSKADTPSKLAEEVKKITEEYQKSLSEFYKDAQQKAKEAKTDEEREKIYSGAPKADKTVARLLELTEKAPKNDPAIIDALQWVLNYSRGDGDGQKTQDKVLDLLIKDYAENEKIGAVVTGLAYSANPKAEQLLKAVMEKNSKKDNRGKATYSLAQFKKNLLQYNEQLKDPEQAKQLETYLGKEMIKAAKEVDKAKLEKELEKLYETVDAKYGDVELYKNPRTNKATLLGDKAKAELFEMKFLSIGKTAPDIEGEDLDAKPLKLSDYRGKVVMLDFWGNW
jgi:hypothetical protein